MTSPADTIRDDADTVRAALQRYGRLGPRTNLDDAMAANDALTRIVSQLTPPPPLPRVSKPPATEPRGI